MIDKSTRGTIAQLLLLLLWVWGSLPKTVVG
jgi:hypothetical protein